MGVFAVMIVHGGGVYGNKSETMRRWVKRYFELSERIRRRLVLEHCEKSYSIRDCLAISEAIYERDGLGIPVVFDTHHYSCYNMLHAEEQLEPASEYMPKVLKTWERRQIKPLFHISEQRIGSSIGTHSDLIDTIPQYLLDLDSPIDLEVEAKLKEQAIQRLYQRYPYLNPLPPKIIRVIPKPKKDPLPIIKVRPNRSSMTNLS
jgi:UV DNA damage endonuclease